MEKITVETPCKICGCGIVVGNMAQVAEGYVCEECVFKMANSDLVEIDASQTVDTVDAVKQCRCEEYKDSTMACPLHGPTVQWGG